MWDVEASSDESASETCDRTVRIIGRLFFYRNLSRNKQIPLGSFLSARLMVLPGLKSPATAGCWNPARTFA